MKIPWFGEENFCGQFHQVFGAFHFSAQPPLICPAHCMMDTAGIKFPEDVNKFSVQRSEGVITPKCFFLSISKAVLLGNIPSSQDEEHTSGPAFSHLTLQKLRSAIHMTSSFAENIKHWYFSVRYSES